MPHKLHNRSCFFRAEVLLFLFVMMVLVIMMMILSDDVDLSNDGGDEDD